MGCKSAAKSKLEEETVASSSEGKRAIQSPIERNSGPTIQDQGGKSCGLGDDEESEESNNNNNNNNNAAGRASENSETSVVRTDDSSVAR